jgi:hypothetical protein
VEGEGVGLTLVVVLGEGLKDDDWEGEGVVRMDGV